MTHLLAAGDPLFARGIDLGVVLIVIAKTLVTFGILLVSVLLMIWFERKAHADMTNRVGPDRAGPHGVLQTVADGIKFIMGKEDLLPERADKRIFRLAPYLSAVPAFLAFSIVPIGGTFTIAHHTTRLQLADPPIGILFLLAVSSIAVYGVMLAGWSSGSKYPLLGAVRASAQMVSYEAALGLSTAAVVLATGSLAISDIVTQQGNGILNWNLIRLGVVPFVVFLIAATAETNRPPFDLVEAEQELVGGFHTEYSSARFAMFYLAEFMNTITMSAIVVTLFLGGPSGPAPQFLHALWPIVWFFVKLLVFLFLQVWLRATLPRFRYDQLMDLGWKVLIPLSLGWLLILATLRLDNRWYGMIAGLVGVLAWMILVRAIDVGRARVNDSADVERVA